MSDFNKNKKIIFLAGSGSGGPVTPLLALARYMRQDFNFVFIGTRKGPERGLAEAETSAGTSLVFKAISGGKWRRYFSWRNFFDIFRLGLGFFQSFGLIWRYRPAAVASAGGFVAVPLVFAAWCCRVPILVHQQDVRPGLANRLCAPFATVITVTFAASRKAFGPRARVTGNPVRLHDIKHDAIIRQRYNLDDKKPLLLVLGGGTGAVAVNVLLANAQKQLLKYFQIIHLTGLSKIGAPAAAGYQAFDFLPHDRLLGLLAAADIVVSRCGLGALSEISTLGKPSVLIPIPNSHQEDNAQVFKAADAAIVLDQRQIIGPDLARAIIGLWQNKKQLQELRLNSKNLVPVGTSKVADILKSLTLAD
jgi:UDP-N-acetylglucosamine--N-acetylmuramyl-(pentapeptide) pyrophosphoryl-undecaprenol N-acetylglucosamine transferase